MTGWVNVSITLDDLISDPSLLATLSREECESLLAEFEASDREALPGNLLRDLAAFAAEPVIPPAESDDD